MLTPIARRTGIILLAAATVLPLAAHAQQSNDRSTRKPNEPKSARPSERPSGMKPCPEYGAGFYKVDGSETCVRIGGGVGIDIGGSGSMGGRR
jgi:hypothetical protein